MSDETEPVKFTLGQNELPVTEPQEDQPGSDITQSVPDTAQSGPDTDNAIPSSEPQVNGEVTDGVDNKSSPEDEETNHADDEDDTPAHPPENNRGKGKRLSISERMRPIVPSENEQASPQVNDSYFQNKWWRPSSSARLKSSDAESGQSAEVLTDHPDETEEETKDKIATEVYYDSDDNAHVNRPKLAPLLMPSDGSRAGSSPSTPKLRTSSSRLSFSISDSDVVSPAEKVRHILTSDIPLDVSADVFSGQLHALFCQMDVLCHFDDGIMGWKECARWLKYEEKVESGDRWSKPHVPTTALHALFEVRKAISENTCSIILDMEATHGCMHQVAAHLVAMAVVDTVNNPEVKGNNKKSNKQQQSPLEDRLALEHFVELITEVIKKEKQLTREQTKAMTDVLLRPHKHKHRKGKKKGEIKEDRKKENNNNNVTTPVSANDDSVADASTTSKKALLTPDKKDSKMKKLFAKKDEKKPENALTYTYPGRARPDELKAHKPNKKLMGKIAGGSEAANIMIGQVDFLEEPIMVFVRLRQPQVLSDLTEVTVPTRFMFLVLGPPDEENRWEYEEVGRAMAALFIDKVFCEVAYKASTRQDLVDGIDEYVDDLTVLPPSIWDPSTRLDPPNQTVSIDKIKNRLNDSSRHAAVALEAFHMDQSAGEDVTLSRTGRLFGGMWKDIKRRYPLYWSDIRDGFHPQCLASVLFLYFACITPIVTFGGLLGGATDGMMGTMETMVSGALCGLIYHVFAGQPLTIVGATGPLLIFESILFLVCKEYSIDFLAFRFYTGMWVVLLLLIFVAFDLSSLVKFITRFTEESFAVLISLIFIFEAFKKLAGIWHTHPIHIHAIAEDDLYKCHCVHPNVTHITTEIPIIDVNGTSLGNETQYRTETIPVPTLANWTEKVQENCITYQNRIIVDKACISEQECTESLWLLDGPACNIDTVTHAVPDVFFLCCFLFIGTFVIAYFFRMFRSSAFFPTILRSTVSDFAVLIAIIICTVTDMLLELDTPKLKVPEKFENTVPGRGWIVNPFNIGGWYWAVVALVPALLATILIFLDQQITAVIVNRKEHKLKKSHGYHLDLFVLAVLIALCSLLGLPWFVAATVRSITHVRSLMRQSELQAPGERPQFLGVREQRLTGICIHIMIGMSVFLTSILKHVPMAVLYGVFLYMGVTSLGGVQFVDRILILFMPGKYQPDHIYLRHVQTNRVHIFTVIQIVCMVSMWLVKSIKSIAIAFPVMILALCFVRKAMDFVFTQRELYWLDHLLPEATRKAKEDQGKDGDDIYMDEITLDEKSDDAELKDIEKDLILDGNWDKMIAKRDYGVGRKARSRKLSKQVIARYDKEDEATQDKLLPYK